MKNSNIQWIGDIPDNWEITRIGQLYKVRNQKVSDKDFPPLSVTMKGIVPQMEHVAKTNAHDDRKLVKKGDFAINSRSDRRGSCGISKYDGSVSLINTVLQPLNEMSPNYYDWLFHTIQFSDEFYKWGHGIVDDLWTTNWQDMKNISVCVPPLPTQTAIANFLDAKCGEIDALLSDINKQIDTLNELKKATITEAVTKGINKNVKLKDSGIQWIGMIPEGWSTPKIGYIANITSGGTPDRTKTDYWVNGDISWIKTGELQNNRLNNSEEKITRLALKQTSVKLFPKGTLLIAMYGQGKTRGMTALLDKPCTTNQACAGIVINKKNVLVEFLWLFMQGAYNAIRDLAIGAGQPNLNIDMLNNFRVALPNSLAEQQSIADYLDAKCAEFDATINEKRQQISALENYKKSLIYEYVTGKKEV